MKIVDIFFKTVNGAMNIFCSFVKNKIDMEDLSGNFYNLRKRSV